MKYLFTLMLCYCIVGLNAQCFQDRHNTSITDSWQSCELSENPNEERGESHWIMYNLGAHYELGQAKIWNLNAPEHLESGIDEIVIDYANDPADWTELGSYFVPRADASSFYEGIETMDFEGAYARYILITVVSTHGDNECAGFAELRIDTKGVSDAEDLITTSFSLSPNPTSDILNITWDQGGQSGKYNIVDGLGRVMLEGNCKGLNSLDVSDLISGTYQFVVINQEQVSTKKFQVVR